MKHLCVFLACIFFMIGCRNEKSNFKKDDFLSDAQSLGQINTKIFFDNRPSLKEFYLNLLDLVQKEQLAIYSDVELKNQTSYHKALEPFTGIDTITAFNPETGIATVEIKEKQFNTNMIVGIKLLGELFVTSNNETYHKIYAWSPLIEVVSDGVPIGETALFWVKASN